MEGGWQASWRNPRCPHQARWGWARGPPRACHDEGGGAPQLGGRERELAAGAADLRKGAKEPTRRRRGWIVVRGRTSTGPSERLTSIGAVEASTIRQRRPAVPGDGELDTLCPNAARSLWDRPANTPTRFTTKVPHILQGGVRFLGGVHLARGVHFHFPRGG